MDEEKQEKRRKLKKAKRRGADEMYRIQGEKKRADEVYRSARR